MTLVVESAWRNMMNGRLSSAVAVMQKYNLSTSQEVSEETIVENERKRNKSRMKPTTRKKMLGVEMPLILFDYQTTVRYQRKLYAQFGRASGIDPGIMWPSEKELRKTIEIEAIVEKPLQEMLKEEEERKQHIAEERINRLRLVEEKMANLNTWIKELQDKKAKKIAEAQAIKLKRDKLIEEVRQYFGYKLDPKDPKFQEVLEKKEREEKKMLKEEKRKERAAKEMARLSAIAQQSLESTKSIAEPLSESSNSKK